METKNPRGANARASVSIAADTYRPTRNKPILQANAAMQARLKALLWSFPWTWEAGNG
jgi:hypothetical protein